MSSTTLPENYGIVFGGLFATVVANGYLQFNVIKARTKYGIKYPALYADKSHIGSKGGCKNEEDVTAYNCAQRAHQNTAENMATIQLLGAVNGLLFPRFAGGCLFLYAIGRVLYGWGYVNNGVAGRMAGGIVSHLADVPLFICTAYSGLKLAGYA